MKKLIAVMVLGILIGTASIFAFGIGVQGGGGVSGGRGIGGAALTFKLDTAPWVFAVDWNFARIGISADQWFLNKPFASPFNFYVGWGVYVGMGLGGENLLAVGGRIPIGINAFFLDGMLEPYFQIVPSIGVSAIPGIGLDWGVAANLGFRFWL